jgi:hypothetical protein
MAYDRYDTRRGSREPWRADDRFDRERGYGDRDRGYRSYDDRDERGFFERAGDEIASWFGDDEAERRRRQDMSESDRGDYRRDRDFAPRGQGQARWDRNDESRGMFGRSTNRGEPERYRPMAGDYGRSEGGFSRGRSERDEFRRPRFAGSSEQAYDPHYAEWRRRQLDELDRDYHEYRRENQSRFESDFGDWRSRRQGKRQMLGSVREHMEVVGSDDEHVGTVDRVAGDRIILIKSDAEAGGVHHSLPCTLVDRIEEQRVILDCDAEQAKQNWRDESRERALFEREDQGEAGPHMLDRSFSGTYR